MHRQRREQRSQQEGLHQQGDRQPGHQPEGTVGRERPQLRRVVSQLREIRNPLMEKKMITPSTPQLRPARCGNGSGSLSRSKACANMTHVAASSRSSQSCWPAVLPPTAPPASDRRSPEHGRAAR